MADKPLPWFRAYPEAAFDPKFDIVSRQTGMDALAVFGAWWKILCLAGSSPVRGSLYVTAAKRYTIDDVTALLRLSNETSNALMTSFIDLEMLDIDENGAYHVKNWEKRQFDSDNSTKRVQKHRAKKQDEQKPPDETPEKRYTGVTVTPPESESDTDTELKEDAPPHDPFYLLQRTAEGKGIRLNSPDDSKKLTALIAAGATVDDLLAGIEWKAANNGGKAIQYFGQIVGPTEVAMKKRLQSTKPVVTAASLGYTNAARTQ